MSLRELIILLLGLAIVGIILRGLYVALQARRGQLRIAIDKNIPTEIDLEALELAELPSGGARVVSRESADDESPVLASLDAANQRAESLSLGVEDEAVPVLMDSVEVGQVAQIDTAASNTTHDDERSLNDDQGDDWDSERDHEPEDYWAGEQDNKREDEADFVNAGAATPENVFEAGRIAGEPDSMSQRGESPAAVTSQDLFDDEPGEKQDPRIGDLPSYEAATANAHGESADEYDGYDDYDNNNNDDYDEVAPAESRDEIGIDTPTVAQGLGDTDAGTEPMAAEHPDDVLFDYDNEEADEHDRGEAYKDDTYEDEAYEDEAYEDDEETEGGSVFLSGHAHVERIPPADSHGEAQEPVKEEIFFERSRAKTGEESYAQDYEDVYEGAHTGTQDQTYDDEDDDIDADDAHEIVDQSSSSEDEFAEFSMTAGERIGGNPNTEKQAGLFEQFDESEQAALADRGKTQKKPSLFAALKRRFTATDADNEELSASSPVQPNAASEQSAELDLVDPPKDTFAESITESTVESVAGDTEEYVAAPAQATEPAGRIQPVPESPSEQPAVAADSQFNERDTLGWDETEDSEPATDGGSAHEEPAVTQDNNVFEDSEAEATQASHDSRQIDWAGTAKSEPRQQSPVSQPSEIKQQTPAAQPSEVIVLNVVARGGREFRGDDLLEVLITSGLKFGEINIFHQRFRGTNNGPVIFSVANILNPGTFDLNSIHEFSTVGVSLFLALPSPINNLEAFDLMLGVAQRIQEELDGELKDDHRNVMTAQTIEHYRQRIRDFELRQLKAAGGRA
ncbi:MAG: cell division protein ZipA [Pseudomonadales bacterium]|nr:cell division protein ZipA [Pseudomonadales bacterium]